MLHQRQNKFLSHLLPTKEEREKGRKKERFLPGESMNTVEEDEMFHPIVTGIGTNLGRTVITEDGEDNSLDLCIGPAGWRKCNQCSRSISPTLMVSFESAS